MTLLKCGFRGQKGLSGKLLKKRVTPMENRNDRILDALIESAADDALFQDMNEMPSCEDLDKIYKPSPVMDKKMKRLITRVENKRVLKLAGKIAAVFLASLVIVTTVLFSVEASRYFILNTYIQWSNDHVSFRFDTTDSNNIFSNYSMNYIPEGFTFYEESHNGNTQTFVFSNNNNNDDFIFFQKSLADASNLSVDNEDREITVIKIHNSEAYLFTSKVEDKYNSLVWNEDNIAFILTSSLSTDELIKIAENITKR